MSANVSKGAAGPGGGPFAPEAQSVLVSYLEANRRFMASRSRAEGSDPLVSRLGRKVVPQKLRFSARLAATHLFSGRERRKARTLALQRPLLLHLGSQKTRKDRWVNVDLVGYPVDLAWDFTRPLPFPDARVDAIFLEHVLEHFTLDEGLALVRETHRLLRADGVLRVGVPDAEAYIRAYVDSDGFLHQMRPLAPTSLLAIQELFYWPGHATMYDFETLALLIEAAGFDHVERCRFGESRMDPCPDSEHRKEETLYVEAVR
jgi:SAM-dependent methyltransferase